MTDDEDLSSEDLWIEAPENLSTSDMLRQRGIDWILANTEIQDLCRGMAQLLANNQNINSVSSEITYTDKVDGNERTENFTIERSDNILNVYGVVVPPLWR